ncbi:hypothetical protein C8N43_2633 [Litoreibacter ponti]|uniref:Uncharacterized protein n=1 Tax=Litoreibacter ponti TaxID=1510457 RepID=A0A2T6BPE6_9RHOB|nr:hypothetical protein C8N43_2633 [Litoreibacter ponti]
MRRDHQKTITEMRQEAKAQREAATRQREGVLRRSQETDELYEIIDLMFPNLEKSDVGHV